MGRKLKMDLGIIFYMTNFLGKKIRFRKISKVDLKFKQTTVVFIIASKTVAEVIAFFLIINTTTPGTFEFANTTGYSCKYS